MQNLTGRGPRKDQRKKCPVNGKQYLIPKSWVVKDIKQTSTLKGRIGWQGLTTAEYLETGDYFLITGTDFKEGKIRWSTCHFVSEKRYSQDKNIQIREKDVLITKDGTIGKIAYVNRLPKAATLNSGIFVLRTKGKAYVPSYMYFILSSAIFEHFIENLKAGSTIAHLYQRDFVNFQFPAPVSNEEQEKIAAVLQNIDNAIDRTKDLIEKCKKMKRGLVQDLFGDVIKRTNPVSIKDFSRVKGGKRMPKGSSFADFKTDFPYLRVIDFKDGTVDPRGLKYVLPHDERRIRKYKISKRDVYITIAGTIGLVGAIPDKLDNALLTENAAKITEFDSERVNKEYLAYFASTDFFQGQITREIGTGGGVPKLALFRIEKLKVYLPEREEQDKLVRILKSIGHKIAKEDAYLDKLAKMKVGLMQDLLTGKNRVVA